MSILKKSSHGFTLLEILLVVGIISLLAGIVIIAINPGKQLATVRNTQRKSDLKQLNSAITQYYISEQEYPADVQSADTLTEICDTGNVASTTEALDNTPCDDLVNLSTLVPTYITAIPKDPQGPNPTALINTAYAATGGTGYYVMKDTNNKIVLNTERAELGTVIAIGTNTAMTGEGEEGEGETPVENTSLLCSNNLDDDEDGDTDCDDTDCTNTEACIVASLREGLVGYWPLDETSGTTASDESVNNNNGTLLGGVLVNQVGRVIKAMSFDGVDDYFTIGSTFGITNTMTLSAWVYLPTSSSHGNVINIGNPDTNFYPSSNGVGIGVGGTYFENTGNHLVVLYNNVAWKTGSANIGTGWHHIAAVFSSSSNLVTYIDGSPSETFTTTSFTAPTYSSHIGGYYRTGAYNRIFNGLIDEASIWNRALSESEISQLYNNNSGRSLVQ